MRMRNIKISTTLFWDGDSQAVRIPSGMEFPAGTQMVNMTLIVNDRIISTGDNSWDNWFDEKPISPDFFSCRDQETPKEQFYS